MSRNTQRAFKSVKFSRVFGLLTLLLLASPVASALQKSATIDVWLDRTRPHPGEMVEVTIRTSGISDSLNAVLLQPSQGVMKLALQRLPGGEQSYKTSVPLAAKAPEGLYVVHVWSGDPAKPSAVGKATFLLGRVVADFFVANYLDEAQPATDLDSYLKALSGIGGNLLVAHNLITANRVYYPSKIAKPDVVRRFSSDIVELVLNRADRNGYAVLLSVSWDMTRESPYKDRMSEIKSITSELYELYKHHPSLAGFYSYQEGSGTYFVPYVREFSQHVKNTHRGLLTACAPHMDDPLLAGYLSAVEELDILIYQTGVMASYRTDNRKKYPFRRVKDFCSLAAGAKRLQNKISINHVELFGYLENRLNPDTAATTYENIYRQILSAATVTDADGISFFTYQAHVHVPLKKFAQVKRSHAAVADGLNAFNLITAKVSLQRNPLAIYFPYSDWIIERWPNYFLPALDAFRVLGIPVDIIPYAPPLEESVYPYYPFHMNQDVLARLLRDRSVLILPNVSGFQQTDSDLIRSFVEQGGVVVAFGPQIPMGRTYERADLFGVHEAQGTRKPMSVVVLEPVGHRTKAGASFPLDGTALPVWTMKKGRVIATFENKSPAIVANKFGKGTVISFFSNASTAANNYPALALDVLDYALKESGVSASPVDIAGLDENSDIAVGKTTTGFSVAIVNHNAEDLDVTINPTGSRRVGSWVDLVNGSSIETGSRGGPLKLTIKGSGVRVLEFSQAGSN